MRKLVGPLLFTLAGFIALAYFVGPLWTGYSLREAAQRGDAVAISRNVDFETLRISLKSAFNAQITGSLAADSGSKKLDSTSAGLVSVFAPLMVNGVVDGLVTPLGLARMFGGGRICESCVKSMGFAGLTRFEVGLGEATRQDVYAIAVFEPVGFSWKLTQIIPLKPMAEWPGGR